MNKSLAAGLGVAATLAVLTVGGLAAPSALGPHSHSLTLSFPTADGLVSGSDVLEAGSKIGFIQNIEPQPNNTAVVTVQISDANWPLHQGVAVDIRPKSLLGEKYVDIHDGPSSAHAYNANATLVASATAVPVELDQFINSLDPQTRVAAQTLLDDLGAGVAGQGPNLNTAIAQGKQDLVNFALTGRTLNNRDPQLDQILVGLDGVLGTVTTDGQLTQLSQLITNGQTTLNAIEAEQATFSRSFNDASVTLAELNTAINTAVPNLQATLEVAPQLTSNLSTETALLAQVAAQFAKTPTLSALQQGIIHGPTATGGAVESHGGSNLPIFRICLLMPTPNSCSGTGFNGQSPSALPASYGAGPAMSSFAAWLTS